MVAWADLLGLLGFGLCVFCLAVCVWMDGWMQKRGGSNVRVE